MPETKKPRPLLQKIWDQMVQEATGSLKTALESAAFDHQKSFYTPHVLDLKDGKVSCFVSRLVVNFH